MIKAGIIGSTGYAGQELVRILTQHKDAEVVWYGSRSYIDQKYYEVFRNMFQIVDDKCLDDNMDELASKVDVIFICTFDYFKKDAPVYFFQSWDIEKNLPLDDFSYKIVLNAACSPDKVPEKLKPLYAYLNDPRQSQVSPLTRMIDARVKKFNTDEWRRKYMTFEYMLKERERIGIEQGRAEGEAIGLKKGAAQKQREIAKSMIKEGIAKEIIKKVTGLSADEIEEL